jgi:class 3 adenylate cyclase
MRDLPTGTVTLVFTDIEGSTLLLRELGERYVTALSEHRAILREAFAHHGGFEVSTKGDSFFVVFQSATEAIDFAVEAQIGLRSGPIWVRMGLHTGEPFLSESDYVGLDVHLAARIAESAHGGQVVLSARTRELLPRNAPLKDLGRHPLKDFEDPVQLFQFGEERFPPLRTFPTRPYPGRPAFSSAASARFPKS